MNSEKEELNPGVLSTNAPFGDYLCNGHARKEEGEPLFATRVVG